jgi:hypothetical protein
MMDALDSLEVVSTCKCGCDTIEFRGIDWTSHPRPVASGPANTPDGREIGLLVFATDERVVCLEVYSYDDNPARLPRLDSIRTYGAPTEDAAI